MRLEEMILDDIDKHCLPGMLFAITIRKSTLPKVLTSSSHMTPQQKMKKEFD